MRRSYAAAILVLLAIAVVLVTLVWPTIRDARHRTQTAAFLGNLDQLCAATFAYADIHDGRLPPPDSWPTALQEGDYLTADRPFTDPSAPDAGRAYAMNARLAGLARADVARPSWTVMFFECRFGAPPAGGPELLPDRPRRPGGYAIAFCDGHTEQVTDETFKKLIWQPRAP